MEGKQKVPFCPKNVRQIGEIENNSKIYIEDYVITFLNQIAKRGEVGSKAVLFLGQNCQDGQAQIYIINGAICAKKQRLEEGRPLFDEVEKEDLFKTKKEFFEDSSILGWGIIESPFNTISQDTVWKDMQGEFCKENKIFFYFEPEDKKETIFLYQNNIARPMTGYLVYYDSNENMQNYLLAWHEKQKDAPLEHVRDIAMKQFRSTIFEKKEEQIQSKIITFFYAASTIMMIILCVMGITMLNNYEKLKKVEVAMNHLLETMEDEKQIIDEKQMIEYQEEVQASTQTKAQQMAKTIEAESIQVTEGVGVEEAGIEEAGAEETGGEEKPVIANVEREYYIVNKGDTLSSISIKFYATTQKVTQICEVNNITDANAIKIGDKILLPDQ